MKEIESIYSYHNDLAKVLIGKISHRPCCAEDIRYIEVNHQIWFS